MPPGGEGRGAGEAAVEAARALEVLFAPIRFAVRDGFAGLARLAGFEALVRGAVERARAAGAPDSAALRGLGADARGFDALPEPERRRAILRIAGHLSSLVAVPEELRELAARGRVEARAAPSVRPERSAAGAESKGDLASWSVPDVAGPTPHEYPPLAPEPRDAAERHARRAKLRTPLAEVPRAHPAPRALLEERGHLTVEDALSFWPKAYEDRSRARRIAELRLGEEGLALGDVRDVRSRRMRNGRSMLELDIADPTGRLGLVFFNA
ncbi:MAG: DNA helicase RecG, partial [Anaeromyxobacteraceae bacterium]